MSRSKRDYEAHVEKMDGLDQFIDEQRGSITDGDLQRMFEEQQAEAGSNG
jgi:hypothetical protein